MTSPPAVAMATQPSYVTELTATTSQQQQPPASAPPPAGTTPFGAELPGGTAPGAPPPAPPAPAPPPQQFIVVTVAGEHPKTAAVCSKNLPSPYPLLLGVTPELGEGKSLTRMCHFCPQSRGAAAPGGC